MLSLQQALRSLMVESDTAQARETRNDLVVVVSLLMDSDAAELAIVRARRLDVRGLTLALQRSGLLEDLLRYATVADMGSRHVEAKRIRLTQVCWRA